MIDMPASLASSLTDEQKRELEGIREANEKARRDLLLAELGRYSAELLPGAAARIVELESKKLASPDPGRLARNVNEFIRSPRGERFRRIFGPDAKPPEDPLRSVLNRHSDRLREGAAEQLYDSLALDWVRRPEPEIAGHVATLLASHRSNGLLKTPNDPPRSVMAVREALKPWARQLKPGAIAELGDAWESSGGLDPKILAAVVKTKLSTSTYSKYLKSGQFDPHDFEWKRPAQAPTS